MRRPFLLASVLLVLAAVGGALAQQQTVSPLEALNQALDEERRGIAYIQAMMDKFGEKMPLTVVMENKRKKEQALVTQYGRFKLNAPGDRWKGSYFELSDDKTDAADMGEFIEVDTAALYIVLSQRVEDQGLKNLFTRLGSMSKSQVNFLQRISHGWRPLRDQDIDVDQEDQAEHAQAAVSEAFSRFMSALQTQLAKGDPADAIAVCKEIAPRITREVSDEYKVQLGRTSWALRNPNNVGPLWTEWLVDDMPTTPKHAADKSGRLGSVFPIVVQDACLTCHGPRDRIPASVQQALDEFYINDEAVGFESGDLRGWFWVESPPVPAKPKNARPEAAGG
jgi:uncharacterized protein with PIN domain